MTIPRPQTPRAGFRRPGPAADEAGNGPRTEVPMDAAAAAGALAGRTSGPLRQDRRGLRGWRLSTPGLP